MENPNNNTQNPKKTLIHTVKAPGYSEADIKITIKKLTSYDALVWLLPELAANSSVITVTANNKEFGLKTAEFNVDTSLFEKFYAKVQNGVVYIFGEKKEPVTDKSDGVTIPIVS